MYQTIDSTLADKFIELLRKKELVTQTGRGEKSQYNVLADANMPVKLTKEDKTIQFISDHYQSPTSFDYESTKSPQEPKVKKSLNNGPWLLTEPVSKEIDYPNFILKNIRELCYNASSNNLCNQTNFCKWIESKNTCSFSLRRDLLIDYVNKITEEFVQNEMKASEILKRDKYFVSDIVSYNVFTERPNEKIVATTNININNILSEVFGKKNIPQIGKRRNKPNSSLSYEQLNIANPLREMSQWYIQNILENNNSIFRAFANVYFWLMHPYHEKTIRNLGYYSLVQTNLANIYKSQVIEWLLKSKKNATIRQLANDANIKNLRDFVIKLNTTVHSFTNCIIELFVLSKINETMIYVHDENLDVVYVFHPIDGIVLDIRNDGKKNSLNEFDNFKKKVHLQFYYVSENIYPDKIEALYLKD